MYQFLERPEETVTATFGQLDVPELEAGLGEDRSDPGGRVPTDPERLRVLGLSGARCRLRGAGARSGRGRAVVTEASRVAALYDIHGKERRAA